MHEFTSDFLRRVPVFSKLDEETRSALALRSRRREFRAEVPLFCEGDPSHSVYVVISGCISLQRSTAAEVVHLGYRRSGELLGELSLVDGGPHVADAVTVEPSELLALDRGPLMAEAQRSPALALAIACCLAQRLRESADLFESYQCRDVLGRVADAILQLMDLRKANGATNGKHVPVPISQKRIAEIVGTTRESVNRACARLKQANAIGCDPGTWQANELMMGR